MKQITFPLSLFLSLLLFSGCSEDESNETAGYRLNITAASAKKALTWNIQSATAYVHEVELEQESDSDTNEMEVDIEGLFEVNLLTGVQTPQIPTANIDPGQYNELEIELGDENEEALDIRATYTDSSGTVDVVINLFQELEFEIENEDGNISIPAGVIKNLQVTFPVLPALQSLDLSNATRNGNVINIGNGDNPTLAVQFLAALNLEVDD